MNNKLMSPEKVRFFFSILLLCILVIIEFIWKSTFFGFFIIAFCLFSILFRKENFPLIAAMVLIISVVNIQNISDWVTIANSSIFNINLNLDSVLTEISTPNSGEEVIPKKIQQMLSLLRTNDIGGYQLSDAILQDGMTIQRITESAWPIKNDNTSPYYLCLIEEMNTNLNCTLIDQRKDVILEYCP